MGELPQISKRTGAAASAWQAGSWPEIIQNEFAKLKYGKLSIVVQGNRITQLERVEKQRFTGIDGEGI